LEYLPTLDHILYPNKELSAGDRVHFYLLHNQMFSLQLFGHTLNPSPKEWVYFKFIKYLDACLKEGMRIAACHLSASIPVVLSGLVGGWVEVDVCVVTG
jgi:hypothetical protein